MDVESNLKELEDLRSQIATANHTTSWNHNNRSDPLPVSKTNTFFKIVFERLDNVDEKLESYIEEVTPKLPRQRKKIGIRGS